MAASIGDVAKRAGVSVATVSRALRGLPNVAPSTRQRVLDAAAQMQYVADPYASRLAAGRTKTVAVVVPLFSQWYFTQVVAGAEAVLAAAGYDLLLYNVTGPESRARFLTELPFRKRVDGVVLVDLPLGERQQATLAEAGVPIVAVGVRSDRFASVTIDNVAAAMDATRHLVELGHERIGLISHLPGDPLEFTAPIERREGYERVLETAGLPVRPEFEVPGNFSLQGGAEAMAQLLAAGERPTAVFAESDEMAIGALKTVADHGWRVPDDVSVIGFDDHEMAHYFDLTTVGQPVVEQGELAATLLLEHLAGLHRNGPPRFVIPTSLEIRATTAAVPAASRLPSC